MAFDIPPASPLVRSHAEIAGRRNLIETALALLALGVLIGLSFRALVPFVGSFLWAVIMVVPGWPVAEWLQGKLGGRRSLAAALIALAFFVLLALPLIYLSLNLEQFVQHAWGTIIGVATQGLPPPPAFVGKIPLVGTRLRELWQRDMHNLPTLLTDSQSVLIMAGQLAFRQMTDLAAAVGEVLFGIVLATQLLAAGPPVVRVVQRFAASVGGHIGIAALEATRQAILAVALWLTATALVEAALSGCGFAMAGLALAPALAFLCFLLRVLQIGPWPVWIPAVAAVWWWLDSPLTAVLLAGWLILAVMPITNMLRRAVVLQHARLPAPLLFLAVLGGLLTWGFSGMFLGAAAVAVVWSLMMDWLKAAPRDPESPACDPAAPITPAA